MKAVKTLEQAKLQLQSALAANSQAKDKRSTLVAVNRAYMVYQTMIINQGNTQDVEKQAS